MKIRNFLILPFLITTLVPALIFSIWSYQDGVKQEFDEVKDRHLLIARNLGFALERYQYDVTAAFESVSAALSQGFSSPGMDRLLSQLNLLCVLNVDKHDGQIFQQMTITPGPKAHKLPAKTLENLRTIASTGKTVFSAVMESPRGGNTVYLVRDFGDHYGVGEISTDYFQSLGKSISFGIRGHAAIVDQFGNILAHPLQAWVASRKNISKVSAVKRMMNGETGIEEFYSPAMKGNMIAGLTSVPGPGWGVMVPQPVSEIYDKVRQNQSSAFLILGVGLAVILVIGFSVAKALSAPLEQLAEAMKANARDRQLKTVGNSSGLFLLTEIADVRKAYNVMVRRIARAGKKIEALAYSDTITGLPNRDHFQSVAGPVLTTARKTGLGGIMVLIDLDNFKEINDLHGHDIGDEFLKACAQKLLKVTYELQTPDCGKASPQNCAPTVARIGGDEFIIMIQGLTEEGDIRNFLDNLRVELATPIPGLSFISNTSASIGCSRFPIDGVEVEELIKRADIAMYHAKKTGKNRSALYSPDIGTQSVAEMRRDLLDAIENDHLVLEYQPKICTRRQQVCGVEALVRWDHPDYGRLMPDVWLAAVHDSPVIIKLGEWVTMRAMMDQMALAKAGHDIFMSVNIASKHFVAPGFVDSIEEIRSTLGFEPERLEIEVTEDALFVSEDQAVATFADLHRNGYRVSIDDFGKGYSNISRLAKLPVDFLKIDRSIIVGAYEDKRTRAILESTINMARNLDCRTVAEGIETLQQAEFASRMGANCLQGYYFAKSMPIGKLTHWLEHNASNAVHAYHERLKEAV